MNKRAGDESVAPILGAIAPILGADVLAEALFGVSRRLVLGLFFSHPDESFHMRQIARLLGLGQGALTRELRRLAGAGILLREDRGHQIYYRVNHRCPIYAELQGLMLKTVGLADVLRASLAQVAERVVVAFVYGSVARGAAGVGSDVDVMVVGSVGFDEVVAALNPAQQTLGREINPTVYAPEEFRHKLAEGSHFLTSVLHDPKIFMIGGEHELERLAETRPTDGAPDQPTRDRRPAGSGGP